MSSPDTSFVNLFVDAKIPHGKTGQPNEPYAYSQQEINGIHEFQSELIEEIKSGKPVVIYFDNDGTMFPFVPNPKDVKMDRDCYEGLVRLAQFSNVTATSLTGRDVHEAAELMLTPGYAVEDADGNILAIEGDKKLRFSIIGSHGVEMISPDNTVARYQFSRKFGLDVNAFISDFKSEAAALRHSFPGIHVEGDKHGSVGINVSTITDTSLHDAARFRVSQLMDGFAKSPRNPTNPATGEKLFQVKREGDNEFDLRPVGFGKDFGIKEFGTNNKSSDMTLFFCDSLHPKEGTDTPAAEYVGSLPKGRVVMVRNGRNERSPLAHVMFTSPALFGAFLKDTATKLEREMGPRPRAQATVELPKTTNGGFKPDLA